MIRDLRTERRGPPQGEAKSLVVFIHGYGANGADLLSLGETLGPHLPGTAFIAPDAPEPCPGNPAGFQWFPVPWIDGSSEEAAAQGLAAAAADLGLESTGASDYHGAGKPNRLGERTTPADTFERLRGIVAVPR